MSRLLVKEGDMPAVPGSRVTPLRDGDVVGVFPDGHVFSRREHAEFRVVDAPTLTESEARALFMDREIEVVPAKDNEQLRRIVGEREHKLDLTKLAPARRGELEGEDRQTTLTKAECESARTTRVRAARGG